MMIFFKKNFILYINTYLVTMFLIVKIVAKIVYLCKMVNREICKLLLPKKNLSARTCILWYSVVINYRITSTK